MRKILLPVSLCLFFYSLQSHALPQYDLSALIEPAQGRLNGVVLVRNDRPTALNLELPANLENISVNGKALDTGLRRLRLPLSAGEEVKILFAARYTQAGADAFMDAQHVFLNGLWYPRPQERVQYRFSVDLPEGFKALSEADRIEQEERGQRRLFRFVFDYPQESLSLAASGRYQIKTLVHRGVSLETWFFPENAALADTYLQHSKNYLDLYGDLLGPYPYQRFAVVENRFPSGWAMPTYTLMGSQVLRLPFIVKTSLGHEILHQWFGSSVYIDFAGGNWAEGLTQYLADHYYAEQKEQGAVYRKQILLNYRAYTPAGQDKPVTAFHSRHNKSDSALGYGKVAMIFHQLRKRFGDDAFFQALRHFIRDNTGRRASWHDVQKAFEQASGESLYSFFGDWLTRAGIPRLSVEKAAELTVEQGRPLLSFVLRQEDDRYDLRLSVEVDYGSGQSESIPLHVKQARQEFNLPLQTVPERVILDASYAAMRALHDNEVPPQIAALLGAEKLIAALPGNGRDKYLPWMEAFDKDKSEIITRHEMLFSQVAQNSLLIGGYDNYLLNMLFGKLAKPEYGASLQVFKNPWNPAKVIAVVAAKDAQEASAAARRIQHYGKYSVLGFSQGQVVHKQEAAENRGIVLFEQAPLYVSRPSGLTRLADILPELMDKRVVYVGEQHDRFAHHLNQLRIIQKLHEAGRNIAIGMEMLQTPAQQALDSYLAGDSDERTFLRDSGYYSKWRYDYNLYKGIIDFAKEHAIPVIALNVEGDIASKVARQGIPALDETERQHLPPQMDFSPQNYREDLSQVFENHRRHGHSEFSYFLQSQTLWDESMAQNAHDYLQKHPQTQLVILAGNGHVRKHYGIPARLYRRGGESYAVIVQDDEVTEGIADYVLHTTEIIGRIAPKLGVAVDDSQDRVLVKQVMPDTPAKQAGLQDGDIIRRVNGEGIKDLTDLKLALFFLQSLQEVPVIVERNGTEMEKHFDFSARTPVSH